MMWIRTTAKTPWRSAPVLQVAAIVLAASAALICTFGLSLAQKPGADAGTTAQTPDIYVAEQMNIGLSSQTVSKFKTAVDGLPQSLVKVFPAANFSSKLKPAADGYSGISEDDIANALEPEALQSLTGALKEAFGNIDKPVVLISLAERGPLMIVSAHLYSPDAPDDAKLKSVDRQVTKLTELTEQHFKDTFPQCIALATRKALLPDVDPLKGTADVSCPRITGEAAKPKTAEPGKARKPREEDKVAAAIPAPSPKPAPTPQPPQPGKGMLDDVPDKSEGVSVLLPDGKPQTTKPAAPVAPGTPSKSLPLIINGEQPKTRLPNILGNQGSGQPSRQPLDGQRAASTAGASVPEEEIVKRVLPEIFAIGVPWVPEDQNRQRQILNAFQNIVREDDRGRGCLNSAAFEMRQERSTIPMANRLQDDLATSRFRPPSVVPSGDWVVLSAIHDYSYGYRSCFGKYLKSASSVRMLDFAKVSTSLGSKDVVQKYSARQPTTLEAFIIAAHLYWNEAHAQIRTMELGFYFYDEIRNRKSIFYYRVENTPGYLVFTPRLKAFDFVSQDSRGVEDVQLIEVLVAK